MAEESVVVVESPAKAKTINKYLGKNYRVLASFGHVRDLPAKDGSVEPDRGFAMTWDVDGKAEKRLREIAAAVKSADKLILATDPDREGEAISWHISEEMKRRRALGDRKVERVVFNEITKAAVTEAFRHPRALDQDLVDAYLARRALDYLVGFTLSPLLWRKLPGSRSAGRVQSVALRLVCEREAEIEAFRPQEYWTVEVELETPSGARFTARLVELHGKKLDKFELGDKGSADAAARLLEGAGAFTVDAIERKQVKRNPLPPLTTSTLQQEASRRLGFGASRTMRIAQKLYEGVDIEGETVGLITYMRTDGVQLAEEAIRQARRLILDDHGDPYLPPAPRHYKTRSKNAQEAHEAIRPTDLYRRPASLARVLDRDELALYELIWVRTLASQMASAELEQVGVDIGVDGAKAKLRATGSVVTFDGFLKLYQEVLDDPVVDDAESRRLPKLAERERLQRQRVIPEQHFTQPPPRYSEASLIKKLEELGIGRPSTYTSILQTLQDRQYVRLEKRRFLPEDRGRIVTAFLAAFFPRYVEYDFTAQMEEQLDDISGGRIDYQHVLEDFWRAFKKAVEEAQGLRIAEVIDTLDQELGPHFFPVDPSNPGKDPRLCPLCGRGRLGLRLGKSGGFIGCSNYPECRFTRPLALPGEGDAEGELAAGAKVLGTDPESGQPVSLRKGPYGTYVQLGEGNGDEKPKRSSLPKGVDPANLSLERALQLLSLPREVGRDPDTGETIQAAIGRFGPYLRAGNVFANLRGDDDLFTIGLNRAVTLIAEAREKRAANTRELGTHPRGGEVLARKGRFGNYVQWGKVMANLPRGTSLDDATLEMALPLLEAKKPSKGKKAKAKPASNGGAVEAPARKATAKKTSVRKTAAKKTAAKQPKKPAKASAKAKDS
ncbi:MAG TPA: type I DNA topoisomerase [Kiloniellales bacterium]|nr:type I DNA topoisomerase [Kiloniellales bacterium]